MQNGGGKFSGVRDGVGCGIGDWRGAILLDRGLLLASKANELLVG
jgi:hypothetical protein